MPRSVAVLALFLSGAAGLLYQVVWIRRAALVFGSTTLSLGAVGALFLLGLALGSRLFGRVAARSLRPLRLFALIQLAVAALAAASPWAFDLAEVVYGSVYRRAGGGAPLTLVLRTLLVGAILLPPTFLMGAALPLVCRRLVTSPARVAGPVGLLYAANTLGGVAGCLGAGLALLPRLGVARTLLVGVALDLLAACAVAFGSGGRDAALPAPAPRPPAPPGAALLAGVLAATGFAALGAEVLWARFLALLVPSTVHAYTASLAAVLLGIVLGSGLAAALFDRALPRGAALGGLCAAYAVLLPLSVWVLARSGVGDPWWAAAVLVPPAAVSGALLPLAVRLVASDPAAVSAQLGSLLAANTLGGIAGALGVGFLLLPGLGMQATLDAIGGIALVAGAVAWLSLGGARLPAVVAVGAAAAFLWILPRVSDSRLPHALLAEADEELVDVREGRTATVAVLRRDPGLDVLHLEIDRWWQGESRPNHQRVAAHLPLLLHPAPRRVLVVGAGAGQTASRALLHDVERLDVIDIEPAVFGAIRAHFDAGWLDDARVRVLVEDGRSYLAHTDERYDVIALELGQVFRPGVAAFYTRDLYARLRERLRPGGLASQFVPLAFLEADTLRRAVASFLAVFPESQLWYNTAELLLVGAADAGAPLPAEALGRLERNAAVRADLAYAPWGGPERFVRRPEVLLGSFLMGTRGLRALAAGAEAWRDDRPALEYAAARVSPDATNEIALASLLAAHVDPLEPARVGDVARGVLREARAVRARNLADLAASALLRRADAAFARGDPAASLRLADEAAERNPENGGAHRRRGDALLAWGALEPAVDAYRAALAIRADDGLALRGLAFALHRLGRGDEAVRRYRRALRLRPHDAELHNNLGAALAQRGDLAGAERHFGEAVRLRPDYAGARENLAQAERVRGLQRSR